MRSSVCAIHPWYRRDSGASRAIRHLRTACAAPITPSSPRADYHENRPPLRPYCPLHSSHLCVFRGVAYAFRSARGPVERVLCDANIDKAQVHEIVLIVTSTHIPYIVQLVSDFVNRKEPQKLINPDEAFPYNAAIPAAILTGETSVKTWDLLLDDIKTMGGAPVRFSGGAAEGPIVEGGGRTRASRIEEILRGRHRWCA